MARSGPVGDRINPAEPTVALDPLHEQDTCEVRVPDHPDPDEQDVAPPFAQSHGGIVRPRRGLLRSGTVRTPVALFVLALLVRLALIAIYPDAADPDS